MRVRHAVVAFARDHQHRRFVFAEVGSLAVRRELLVGLAVAAPGRAAVFPLVEPDLVGGGVHTLEVPDAVVADDALELVVADGEPVHHVAAE